MGASHFNIADRKPLTERQQAEFFDLIHTAIFQYTGPVDRLEAAVGFLYVGRYLGWRALYIIHSKRTVAAYEKILSIRVRNIFPDVGPHAKRSDAFRALDYTRSYWKVVSGEERLPCEDRHHLI